jgi:hypothetical protein
MLEILLLIALTKRIGAILKEKGRKGGWYQLLLVILWFGGEFAGLLFGLLLTNGGRSGGLLVYIVGLAGAAAGAGLAFMIANNAQSDTSALQRQIEQGAMKRCPHCGNAIPTTAPACEYCHREMPAAFAAPSHQRAGIVADGQGWRCSACGGFVRRDATVCKHCDQPFALQTEMPAV